MVEMAGTNQAGMEMVVVVAALLVEIGAMLPGGRAGAGVLVVAAGTGKQGQCLGFMCSIYLGCSCRDPFYLGTCIDSDVVIILEITSTSRDSAIKSILATSKQLLLKLAG